MTANELCEKYGYWGEHPQASVEDWMYEVANGDTRTDYWTWVAATLGLEEV